MFNDLDKIVDKKFWGIINDLRVHAMGKKRVPFLTKLAESLKSHQYFPSLPLTVKEVDKGYGVARQVPIFNLNDYSVYYYCVRKLEHVLAKNRVEGTYGGWAMGGKIRRLENEDSPGDEYQLTYSYNPAAWAKYYGDYNGRLYGKIKELKEQGKGDYLVYELDIANYYDSIQLDLLEKKIRQDADYKESGILDLLMYFLGHNNRLSTSYQMRTVGIPQDAFGDCSRLLSNYYLQDYDLYMSTLALQYEATYFRYADDQILFVPDDNAGREMIQMASRRLAGLGLNINQKKVHRRTLDELYIYRSFDINDLFKPKGSNKDAAIVNEFADKTFQAIDDDVTSLKDRGYPLIRRLITADYNLLNSMNRARLMGYIFDDEFITSQRKYHLKAAYEKMKTREKARFLRSLRGLTNNGKHSAFHYEVLPFYREVGVDTEDIESRISELRKNIFDIE